MSTATIQDRALEESRVPRLSSVVRKLAGIGALVGMVGGMFLALTMMIVMGAAGMGFASAINLGMPAFVFTITPPIQMLPSLMTGMGLSLPSSAMAKLGAAIHSGHISMAMAQKFGVMLSSMHVPAPKVQMMGLIMTGHASNSTVTTLMSQMTPSARASVMAAMPLNAGHMAVGLLLHFMFSAFLGVAVFAVIGMIAWFGPVALRTRAAFITLGVVGGAVIYSIMRFGLLPSTNQMMGFVPQIAFFLSHLLFGLIVGAGFALAFQKYSLARVLPVRH